MLLIQVKKKITPDSDNLVFDPFFLSSLSIFYILSLSDLEKRNQYIWE